MKIPLPRMMRHWREREFAARLAPPALRAGASRSGRSWRGGRRSIAPPQRSPRGRWAAMGQKRGRFRRLPLAGGWTRVRDMPAPEGRSFQSLWAERQRRTT